MIRLSRQKLKNFYYSQLFRVGIIAFFINSAFISRRGLRREIKKNASYIKGKLLDFGCGNKPYKNLFAVKEYIGLDVKNKGYEYNEGEVDVFYDGEKIPFEDEFFDSIFSSEVFCHIQNLDNILIELNRVLKIGGNILITTPFLTEELSVGYDYWRFTSLGLKEFFKKSGFEVVCQEKVNTNIETIFQLIITYLHRRFPRNNFLRSLFVLIFVPPLNAIGFIFSFIFRQKGELYRSNLIVAKKIKHKAV